MAMLKVNSIIAESHYNVVINKVAGNAISPPHTAHGNKQGDVSIKEKTTEKWQRDLKDDALPENTKRRDNRETKQILEEIQEDQTENGDMTAGRAIYNSNQFSQYWTIDFILCCC